MTGIAEAPGHFQQDARLAKSEGEGWTWPPVPAT